MLTSRIRTIAKRHLPPSLKRLLHRTSVSIVRAEPQSWIARHLRFNRPFKQMPLIERIEERARITQAQGSQPLWEGYGQSGSRRDSEQVRTNSSIGSLLINVTMQRKPHLVVEFGTAFGISGMYWLAGLEANNAGHLLTFEPNALWATIADENLATISNRYTLTIGTFEENLSIVDQRTEKIDLGFIDAIHTPAFVLPQLALVQERCAPGALIFLDDIEFSKDMHSCWEDISHDRAYAASAAIGNLGLIELR
jgi:predicted O-methyltransferase YrrM